MPRRSFRDAMPFRKWLDRMTDSIVDRRGSATGPRKNAFLGAIRTYSIGSAFPLSTAIRYFYPTFLSALQDSIHGSYGFTMLVTVETRSARPLHDGSLREFFR